MKILINLFGDIEWITENKREIEKPFFKKIFRFLDGNFSAITSFTYFES